MKINLYKIGFFIIFALPLFNLPPWLYPPDWGKAIIFRSIVALLLFLFITKNLIRSGIAKLKRNPVVWAMGGLFATFLLAGIFSIDPYFSFWGSPYRGGGLVTFAFYFLFALLAFLLFKDERDWKKFWNFSIVIGLAVSVIAIFQFYGILNKIFIQVESRPVSTIGNPIFLGIYLLLLLLPTLALVIGEKNIRTKIFYISSSLVFLLVIALTGSRASYLGIVTGALVFFLLYPQKIRALKILTAVFLISISSAIIYVNLTPKLPEVLSQNRTLSSITSRMSIKRAFGDERYRAWQIVIKEIKDKPILGWGPENLAPGFDKNFNPSIVNSPWWDKAHNVFLQIGAETGIVGLLAYIGLFIALFWQLHKIKKVQDPKYKIQTTGLQATLAGYLAANFFSFDCVPTYILFFFIIGYILHLTDNISINQPASASISVAKNPRLKWKTPSIIILTIILVIFLSQYNLIPFIINTKINIANNWADRKLCDASIALMDKLLAKRTFIDSYLRMQYIDDLKKCGAVNPEKELEYAKKGLVALTEAVKIQPMYTRFWIYLGSFETIIANNEQSTEIKQNLINQAYLAFEKAESLAPLHIGVPIERAKTDIIAEDYLKMKQDAEKCIELDPKLGQCYWTKALAELYMNDQSNFEKDSQTAKVNGFDIFSENAYYQLIDFYEKTQQYQKIVEVYKALLKLHPDQAPTKWPSNIKEYNDVAQYYASLAFTYAQMGEYEKAREQALIFLQFMPEAKDEVDTFLKTLPY